MNISDRERVYHKSKSRKWGRKDLLAGLTGDVARLLAQNGRILASFFLFRIEDLDFCIWLEFRLRRFNRLRLRVRVIKL